MEPLPPENLPDSRKLTSLLNVASTLNSTLDLHELLPTIMLCACELLEAEASSLFLLDEQREFLYCEVAMGDKKEIIQQYLRLEIGSGIAGWVARTSKSVLIEDAYDDPRFDAAWDQKSGYRTRSLICVPLFAKDQLVGTLEVLNKTGSRVFDSHDAFLLSSLADITGVAVHNAQVHDNLRKRVMELTLLYQFEKVVISGQTLPEMGVWLLDQCLNHLEAKNGTIYLYDDEGEKLRILAARGISPEAVQSIQIPIGQGVAGWVAEKKKPLLIHNLEEDSRYDKTFFYQFESKSLISAPLIYKDELLGVISVNKKINGYAFHIGDLNLLQTIAGRLSISIQNARLLQKLNRNTREATRARRVMELVIPVTTPLIRGLEIGSGYMPLDDVGGDFYDLYTLSDHRIGVLLADVSGHGLSSALLSMLIHTIISTIEVSIRENPSQFLTQLNSMLLERLSGNFVTIFYAIIDIKENSITFANGGHEPPIIVDAKSGQATRLQIKGTVIGVIPDAIYEQRTLPFAKGDRLVCITDGLVEITDPTGERCLSESEVDRLVIESRHLPPRKVPAALVESVRQLTSSGQFNDDVTILALDRI